MSNFPVRISVTTFNVWGENHWPARAVSLAQTLLTIRSDVYLLQEVTPAIIKNLDENLKIYKRISDDRREGWLNESNIYWNDELLSLGDYGFGDLDMPGFPNRGLFWVRLNVRSNPALTVFVSTAHFPWTGHEKEIETGLNMRIPAATKVCEHLRRLAPHNVPVIFGGDLNDDYHPVRILNEEFGLIDVFEALDLPPPITHPVRPSDPSEEMKPNRTLDWILCSLPSQCRVIASYTKSIRGGRYPPVSDHLPVISIIEIA